VVGDPPDVNESGQIIESHLSASYCTGNARTAVGTTDFDHVDFQKSGCLIYTSSPTVLKHVTRRISVSRSCWRERLGAGACNLAG